MSSTRWVTHGAIRLGKGSLDKIYSMGMPLQEPARRHQLLNPTGSPNGTLLVTSTPCQQVPARLHSTRHKPAHSALPHPMLASLPCLTPCGTGFVIARELRAECDPFGGDSSMPDISSKGPYQKRKVKNLLPVNPPDFVPGEKEKRPKMPWLRPPRQHKVPNR